jgi:TniQ
MIIDARLGNTCDGMLPIRWAPLDEESPSSCILRLAAELGHPYATLCKFLNITRHEAARENLRAARILRLSEHEWKALTYGIHKVGRFCKRELRGHILNMDRLCLSRPRICPCCLLASGYCRWYWDLSLYCYCHIHRCEMVSKCDVCKQDVKWNRPAPSFCACGADLARQQPEARAEYGLLCSDIIIAAVQKEKACVSIYRQLLELSLDSVFYLLLRLSQLINRSSSLQTSSSDFAYCREVCLTAGSILADWPNGFHKLLGNLQAQRRYEHPNPMRDLFGSSYHAWLDLVRRPEFGFLVAEYQQFLLHSWKEPVPPQGHVFRLVGASSNVLSLAEAARKANVIPACVMGAYRVGEIEGHFARQKSRRRILWLDFVSFEAWHHARQRVLEQIQPCRSVEEQTGFRRATIKEFEGVGLIQSLTAPPASKIRGLCFDRPSVSRLVESVAIAASQATYADDEPSIALGEAARLYLGRNGLAKFLLSINSNQTNQNGSYSAANKRLFDLKFPLGMILQFKARLLGM